MITFATSKLMLGSMHFKHILVVIVLTLLAAYSNAQKGLEGVIVERYYVSTPQDTLNSQLSGYLAPGSVTYRVFLDLAPGYRFYTAFGNAQHPLLIQSSAKFFNNEYIGNRISNVIPRRTLSRNTVMLDSWLSVGGGGEEYYAIPKEFDDTISTVLVEGKYLKNIDRSAGVPLSIKDGLKESSNVPFPVIYGADTLANVFYNATKGDRFYTENGAWGCLGGALGIDSTGRNHILIAQLTTHGDLEFTLNVQVGKKGEKAEMYVAKNPQAGEFLFPSLNYDLSLPKLSDPKDKKKVKQKSITKETNKHSSKKS